MSSVLRRAVYVRYLTSLTSAPALPLLEDVLHRACLTGYRGNWARRLFGRTPVLHLNTEEAPNGPAPNLDPTPGVESAIVTEALASQGGKGDTADPQSAASVGGGNIFVDPNILQEHRERIKKLNERRQRRPLSNEEPFNVWVDKHWEALEPLRSFLSSHGAPIWKTLAALYSVGYWGRLILEDSLQLTKEKQGDDAPLPRWIVSFEAWDAALAAENLPFSAGDLIRAWPTMLARSTDDVSSTLAILREAIPNPEDLYWVIQAAPKVLGHGAAALQHRLVRLQMVLVGELEDILVKNPKVLETRLAIILDNIRLLRESSRSITLFQAFIRARPDVLTWDSVNLKNTLKQTLGALSTIFPAEINSREVIKAKPSVLLLDGSQFGQRWASLEEIARAVPTWQDELDLILADAATGTPAEGENSVVDEVMVNLEKGAFDPLSFGLKIPGLKTAGSEPVNDELQESHGTGNLAARRAYSALAELVWSHERRHERLQYLMEELPEECANVSLLSVIVVEIERFERRFPDFQEWRTRQGLKGMKTDRQAKRQQADRNYRNEADDDKS